MSKAKITPPTDEEIVMANGIQVDRSGQGHCWQTLSADDDIGHAEEIACWIIEDEPEAGDETTIGGQRFRMPPA